MNSPWNKQVHNQYINMAAIPSAGDPVIITPPTNVRSTLRFVRLRIQTDANAANRILHVRLKAATREIQIGTSLSVITASKDYYHTFGVGLSAYLMTAGTDLIAPLVPDVFAVDGDTWEIDMDSIQATDQLGPIVYVLDTWPFND